MTVLLQEMTRDQIARMAPEAVTVLPTAAIEQHGPHLPILTDTLICSTVAERAARQVADVTTVLVAPTLCYGNSIHHRPFAGVLSLTSGTFMMAVTEILESLVLSGFRRLIVLNGHGGNTEANHVVGLDFPHRLGQPATIATAAYWNIARSTLVSEQLMADNLIPGHAGQFETALVMALRPDLIEKAGLEQTRNAPSTTQSPFAHLEGGLVYKHGAWASGLGYTDDPSAASPGEGQALLDVIVDCVARFFVDFWGATIEP